VFFLTFFFGGDEDLPREFLPNAFFFVAAGGLNGLTLLTRWLASFRHMELTHNENDICMPVPRVQRATGFVFFSFFFRKFVKKKQLGGVMLCDV